MCIEVVKYGSSILEEESDVARVVADVGRRRQAGRRVVAVVSAIAGTTDHRLEQARKWGSDPHATAALLALGEGEAAALTALALNSAGVPAEVVDPPRIGLRTAGRPADGTPLTLSVSTLSNVLSAGRVAVVPGYIGRDCHGRHTVLGRGGSDLTALWLAYALGAECTLVKDVDGVFTSDPATDPSARPYASLSWSDATDQGGKIIQPKGLQWALARSLSFRVAAIGSERGTLVGAAETVVREAVVPSPELAVVPTETPRTLRVAG